MSTPTLQELNRYNIFDADAASVIYQPLYSTKNYPAAGLNAMSFFDTTQGAAPGGLEDTNMEVSGALPSPKNMLVRAIEIKPIGFTYADMKALEDRGHVQFYVGVQAILDEVGLATFATDSRTKADFAIGGTAEEVTEKENAYYESRLFKIEPVRLTPNVNFKVSIAFPGGNVALPSGATNARIRVRLLGHQFRLAQV